MQDKNIQHELTTRPAIEDFTDPVLYVQAMLGYRRANEPAFSIVRATRILRRVSPALVSLVLSRKRSLTPDRAEEFSKLMGLKSSERHYFKEWISGPAPREVALTRAVIEVERKKRKDVSVHILKDWLNSYVKDLFQFEAVQRQPELTEKILVHVATPKRVRTAVQFLLREGYLRKTLDGKTVLETDLAVADPKVPSLKIRQAHKAALGIAVKAIDRVPSNERMANALIVPLNEKGYLELLELIEDFGEKLKDFSAKHTGGDADALYQVLVNASPVGGKIK